jgi:hypothetical protein
MLDFSFSNWWDTNLLDEAVRTHMMWGTSIPRDPSKKDVRGLPAMAEPGFHDQDRKAIIKHHPDVEKQLDQVTQRIGINWLILYLEPRMGGVNQETPSLSGPQEIPPELQGKNVRSWQWFNSTPGFKARAKADWTKYADYSHNVAADKLWELIREEPGVSGSNTVVYIKPTSRVDPMGKWQQMHNIGHAIWDNAKRSGGGRIRNQFVKVIRDAIRDLQQRHYDPETGKPVSTGDIIVMLGRLLDVVSFMRAAASTDPKELDSDKGRVIETAFNSFAEAMYDLIALYFNNGGKINLYPRGQYTSHARQEYPSRVDQIPMPPALAAKQGPQYTTSLGAPPTTMQPANWEAGQRPARGWAKFQTHPWVLEKMASDREAWGKIGEQLTALVDEAIKSCVWDNISGPIYATTGYITTKP